MDDEPERVVLVEVPLHELYRLGEMADVCLSYLTGLECPYCKCGWQADASD